VKVQLSYWAKSDASTSVEKKKMSSERDVALYQVGFGFRDSVSLSLSVFISLSFRFQ